MQPDQRHPELGNLTSLQNAAVDILLTGSTITDAAGKVGVTRRTLHRWLTDDPHFNAELNKRRNDLSRAVDDRLRAIAMVALDTVENAVTSGNVQASLAVLRGIGALDRRRSLPMNDDPAALAVQAELLAQTIMQCEKGVESETSAAPPPKTREKRVESETSPAPNRPDTRRETPIPNRRPNTLHSPHPIPDPLPSNFRDILGQSETSRNEGTQKMRFEPLPSAPPTRPSPNVHVGRTSPFRLESREKRVESETSAAPNRVVPRPDIPSQTPNSKPCST